MTETIENTTYETPYGKIITPEIVLTESEDYALTDIDLIKDMKEMSEFSSLVKKGLWRQSQYVENKVSNFRTKLYSHRLGDNYSSDKWNSSEYTVKMTNPKPKSEYKAQKPKTLIKRLFSFLK